MLQDYTKERRGRAELVSFPHEMYSGQEPKTFNEGKKHNLILDIALCQNFKL